MDLENLKQLMFGTRIQPSASQATLFELIFWPDAFLLGSLLFSTLLLVAIRLFFRKMTLLRIRAGVISVSVIFLFRFVCFLMLVASVSATARMLFFVFGESGGRDGNQAAVNIFSAILLIPTFLCASLVGACGMALCFLLGLTLQK